MSVSINGTNGLVFNDGSSQNTGATGFGFKNRIINGAMMIDQRNAGASVTATTGGGAFAVDRWSSYGSPTSKYTAQRNAGSVTPPSGFTNYLGITSSSAYSIAAGDLQFTAQQIEGFNIADLGWGTASASPVTLSFWVRSSLTGTFGGAFRNSDGTRSYPFVFVISSANTWEQKTITVAGDTTGTWNTTNDRGISVVFGLGVGSTFSGTAGAWSSSSFFSATGATSVVGTNGATFYITGVQLEKGSTATSFDYRPYGTELALCQRYAIKLNNPTEAYGIFCNGAALSSTDFFSTITGFNLRTTPTVTYSNVTLNSGGQKTVSNITAFGNSYGGFSFYTTASGLTSGYSGILQQNNNTAGYILLSSEL